MNQNIEERLLLTETLPVFAAELQQLLTEKGEPELAAQVPGSGALPSVACGKWISRSRGMIFAALSRTLIRNPDGRRWHGLARR